MSMFYPSGPIVKKKKKKEISIENSEKTGTFQCVNFYCLSIVLVQSEWQSGRPFKSCKTYENTLKFNICALLHIF